MKNVPFLLSAFLAAVTCQEPTVSIVQKFKEVFLGDTLVLKCSGSGSDDVKWYHNGHLTTHNKPECIVPVLSTKDKASYYCERNGKMSNTFTPDILSYSPLGSLSIKSGNSVVFNGESVVLNLEVDDDLNEWNCWLFKGGKTYVLFFKKDLIKTGMKNADFQSSSIYINQSPVIYWCEKKAENARSNTVTLTATNKKAILVSHPDLPIYGTKVDLECIVPGAQTVEKVIFYKNKNEVSPSPPEKTYTIKNMTKDDDAEYYCSASYKYVPESNIHSDTSNVQKLEASDPFLKAQISAVTSKLSCSCSQCPAPVKYWYYKHLDNRPDKLPDLPSNPETGIYSCRAVWASGVSMLSDSISVEKESNFGTIITVILIVILVILILIGIVIIFIRKKQRTEALYQEVPLGAVKSDKGDEGYEDLQKARSGAGSGDYDTLKGEREKGGEAEGPRQEGGYEALKTETGAEKDAVYHTIKLEGSDGASKGDAPKGEGAKGAEGGYEALKTAPGAEKDTVYHTIKPEGSDGASMGDAVKGEEAKGREGGYEALKVAKGQGNEGLYHTIGQEVVKQE